MSDDLNRKLAEWAGFVFDDKPRYFEGVPGVSVSSYWIRPNGREISRLPDFTSSLDACFKWLVPKLSDVMVIELFPTPNNNYYCQIKNLDRKIIAHSGQHCDAPAMALCKAILGVVERARELTKDEKEQFIKSLENDKEFIEGVMRGGKDIKEGKVRPLDEVKKELGLD